MKKDLEIVEVSLPLSFDERSNMDTVICMAESGYLERATFLLANRLTDPRAVSDAAIAIGALAREYGEYFVLLDMVGLVEDPKLRFGWLLEILEKADPNDIDGDEVIAKMAIELDRINDDGNFLDRARAALDDLVERQRAPMIALAGYYDPDIEALSLVPALG